jgi:predicted transglutaminase-like cysteine proteinase
LDFEKKQNITRNEKGLSMKKCAAMLLICGVTLGLLAMCGLGCATYYESPTTTLFGMTESEIKAYITPNCTLVLDRLQDILGDPPYELTKAGFDAIRDWVAANVEYKSDEEQWGVEEYWQTPEETLSLYTGDCEDFAVLLCTLLRAYGIGEEQIYVAVGVDNEGYGHAFLIENWYLDGEWRAIEPQVETQTFPRGRRFQDYNLADFKLLRDYEIVLGFNDSYYYDESFPWDEY